MTKADRHRIRRVACAAATLLLVGVTQMSRAAVSAPSPATTHVAKSAAGKSAAAKAPAMGARVSPHARAARARALARAEAEGKPMRVSPFGTTPKPHRPVQPR